MDLNERGWGGINRIDQAQDMDQWRTFVNMALDPWVPQTVGKFLSS
jgi:hypothetical protein